MKENQIRELVNELRDIAANINTDHQHWYLRLKPGCSRAKWRNSHGKANEGESMGTS